MVEWPGVGGRAGFCSPPSPRRGRGQCASCALQVHCWRQAENLWVGTLSACSKKPPPVQEEAGHWKEALSLESPYPGCCHSYSSGHLSQKLETLCLDIDEFWGMVWLVAGPVYEARGVGISAVSWPWGSHSSPFPSLVQAPAWVGRGGGKSPRA